MNPNIDNLPEDVDHDDDWDSNGAQGGESAQLVHVKQMFPNFQDKCRKMERKVPTNVTEAVQLARELLRSDEVPLNTLPSSIVLVIAEEDTTWLTADWTNLRRKLRNWGRRRQILFAGCRILSLHFILGYITRLTVLEKHSIPEFYQNFIHNS